MQQDRISPRKLREAGMMTMLKEWKEDNQGIHLDSSLQEFALNIEELSNGHPGIVGVCCNEFDKEANKAAAKGKSYSTLAFQKHASQALPSRLQQSDTFGRLFSDLEPGLSDAQKKLLRQVKKRLLRPIICILSSPV